MGTIRYREGDNAGLYNHEGWIGQVFEDGSIHSGGEIAEVDRRTVAWRAMCECGWQGATVVHRASGSALLEWEDAPTLDAEWRAHTVPLIAALPPADPAVALAVAELEGLAREIEMAGLHHLTKPNVLEMIDRRVSRLKGCEAEGTNGLGYGPEDIT